MNRLAKWHQTYAGLGISAAAELLLAYGFASLAIDRGSLLWYVLALAFLIVGLQSLTRLIGKLIHGNKATKA